MYKLIKAQKERYAFQELYNRYIEELGEYEPAFLDSRDRWGNYFPEEFREYFSDEHKKPYLVKVGKENAGIAVFSRAADDDESCDVYVEELYVIPQLRRRGTADAVCADYLAENGGRVCGMFVLKNNEAANAFVAEFFARREITPERHDAENMWLYRAII